MQKYSVLRITLFSAIIIVIAYLAYVFFLKEIILNNSSRSVRIKSISHDKILSFGKYAEQGPIYSFEMEIKGKSNENLEFFYGPVKDPSMQQVMLKKGDVDFVYAGDWYGDSCFLILPQDPEWKGDLKITYRFIGTKN